MQFESSIQLNGEGGRSTVRIIYIIFLCTLAYHGRAARDYKVTRNYAENLLAEFGGTRKETATFRFSFN